MLFRHAPPRFDISASAAFPVVHPLTLAHQIRQDLWRLLQTVRGFSPVIQVSEASDALHVQAGGRALPPIGRHLEIQIAELLSSDRHRTRWLRFAERRAWV